MKLVKKWIFPLLTCLIVVGAAILPPYISQVKDERQFAQIHTAELNADALPVRKERSQLERLELYARWLTNPSEIIPSFQTSAIYEGPTDTESAEAELVTQTLNRMEQANVISVQPLWFPLVYIDMNRILLWDTTDSKSSLEPIEFWWVTADLGKGSVWITIDSESGLPLGLDLYDPNMAQWLPYKDPEALSGLAERYFDLLGLKADPGETVIPSDTISWGQYFTIEGTEIRYLLTFNATMLRIGLTESGTRAHVVLDS